MSPSNDGVQDGSPPVLSVGTKVTAYYFRSPKINPPKKKAIWPSLRLKDPISANFKDPDLIGIRTLTWLEILLAAHCLHPEAGSAWSDGTNGSIVLNRCYACQPHPLTAALLFLVYASDYLLDRMKVLRTCLIYSASRCWTCWLLRFSLS